MDILKELSVLASQFIYVSTVMESIGSDEWVFGFNIRYLETKNHDQKRRAQHIQEINSFGYSGGATYVGGFDKIEEALQKGIEYANNTLKGKI